jgi:hypothetical protein
MPHHQIHTRNQGNFHIEAVQYHMLLHHSLRPQSSMNTYWDSTEVKKTFCPTKEDKRQRQLKLLLLCVSQCLNGIGRFYSYIDWKILRTLLSH